MKKRLFSTIVCLVLTMVMLIPTDVVKSRAEAKGSITDYATISTGVAENIILATSYDDFKSQIEMGANPLFTPATGNYFQKSFTITFNENGFLLMRGTGYDTFYYSHFNVYRDSTLTTCVSNCSYIKADTFYRSIPVEAGTYYFDVKLKSFYVGFVPVSSSCKISAREQKNKSVYIDIECLEKNAKINAVAIDGIKSANSCFNDIWLKGSYDSTIKDKTATILLPEPGKYTVMVEVEFNENSYNKFVYQFNTKDLLADAKKMETPISILAGTNAIIGQAKPNATIYATVNGTDYSTKADSNGTYRLKVGKLKKKKSIKMWQVEDGKTTAEGTFKVVTKY